MGHKEVLPLARGRRNKRSSQQEQKRPRITRQARPQSKTKSTMRPTSPGTNTRPQWLKNARNRINKKTPFNDFDTKSKKAAIQHAKDTFETKHDKTGKLLHSSSSECKSITSLDTTTLKFSPTVKVSSIPSDSPGTSYEIVASSTPNDFMIIICPILPQAQPNHHAHTLLIAKCLNQKES